jgi:hypothetical protein
MRAPPRTLPLILVALAACESTTTPIDAAAPRDALADVAPVDAAAVDAVTADVRDAGPAVIPYRGPDDWCPGRDHCTGAGDGRLHVGAATAVINPVNYENDWTDTNNNGTWDWNDANVDGRFQPGEGEAFVDRNNNGIFDAAWIAGFGIARPARGVNDDLQVRAIAFRWNDITVAFAVIDCVGFFANEMDRIREDPMLQGLGVDKVIIALVAIQWALYARTVRACALVERDKEYMEAARVLGRPSTAGGGAGRGGGLPPGGAAGLPLRVGAGAGGAAVLGG